jgi:hypothetical protein
MRHLNGPVCETHSLQVPGGGRVEKAAVLASAINGREINRIMTSSFSRTSVIVSPKGSLRHWHCN